MNCIIQILWFKNVWGFISAPCISLLTSVLGCWGTISFISSMDNKHFGNLNIIVALNVMLWSGRRVVAFWRNLLPSSPGQEISLL